jgi:hypothetical protein
MFQPRLNLCSGVLNAGTIGSETAEVSLFQL